MTVPEKEQRKTLPWDGLGLVPKHVHGTDNQFQ
jgi:hypothetical protein